MYVVGRLILHIHALCVQVSSQSVHLHPVMSLRAFGFKDAGKEKEAAAAGVWESQAKRELAQHVHGRWGGGGRGGGGRGMRGRGGRGRGGGKREREEREEGRREGGREGERVGRGRERREGEGGEKGERGE